MKLWVLTFDTSDHDGYDNWFVDVFAHPPSIDEIFETIQKSDVSWFDREDINPMLEAWNNYNALKSSKSTKWTTADFDSCWYRRPSDSKWSDRYRLRLEEVDRHL